MARMHSGKKGKHGSKKPAKKTIPSWTRYKGKEAELLISKLAKEGKTSSQIGVILRDTYGIPDVHILCGKTISSILKEKKQVSEIPEDLTAMFKRFAAIRKHLENNRHDQTAARGLQLAESKINRLVKYYKRTGRMAETWKFNSESMGFFAE
jgi:small subunit ribosomal protein S15